jgi:hypothetical protein
MYIENIDQSFTDTSYESQTQDLSTATTETFNVDSSNIWSVLLDNGLDLLGDLAGYDVTPTSTNETIVQVCNAPNTLVNGVCTPPEEDKTKKYVMYGIIAVIVIAVGYALYKKYGK